MPEKKQTILEWYQQNQKFIDAPCNGTGNCGRCKVRFVAETPVPKEKEKRLLTAEELSAGIRLACVTEMGEAESFQTVGEAFWTENIIVPKEQEWQCKVHVEPKEPLGVALDIGTTTLAMELVSLVSGKCITTVTSVNHQRSYGADVISRIDAANKGKGTELQICILQDIWNMLKELAITTGMQAGQIKKIAIAGNTTMCHLLLGYSCEGLGKAPFVPESTALTKMTTKELFKGIVCRIAKEDFYQELCCDVVILPGISAFVGADIVAGMYYCDMDLWDAPHMLLDIGTNGEIVIGNRQGFLVTSTAAGPVFEGGNISCGMPAVKGAVSHMKIKDASSENGHKVFDWDFEILEVNPEIEELPKGICGSGLIDLAAELWKEKLIDENGTITDVFFESGVPVKNLCMKQSDIRELQMGKAAIRAGIEVLWEKMIPDKIYLAGGFGTELNVHAGVTIGLLPKQCQNKIVPMGNTVLLGLHKFLLDNGAEERVVHITEKSKEIVLAKEGNFEEKYILFMQFLL